MEFSAVTESECQPGWPECAFCDRVLIKNLMRPSNKFMLFLVRLSLFYTWKGLCKEKYMLGES